MFKIIFKIEYYTFFICTPVNCFVYILNIEGACHYTSLIVYFHKLVYPIDSKCYIIFVKELEIVSLKIKNSVIV